MSVFEIRQATVPDAQRLGHIGVATFVESYTTEIAGAAMMAHCTHEHSRTVYEAYLSAPRTAAWIAEHKDTKAPMGYALNCPPDLPVDTTDTDLELKRIYVLSRFHGQGLAAALLGASEQHARSEGAKTLLLGTYKDNNRAMAFYSKHGFDKIGTRQFNIGGKLYDDIIMAKTL